MEKKKIWHFQMILKKPNDTIEPIDEVHYCTEAEIKKFMFNMISLAPKFQLPVTAEEMLSSDSYFTEKESYGGCAKKFEFCVPKELEEAGLLSATITELPEQLLGLSESRMLVEVDCGDVYINGKFASQLCWDEDSIGYAVASWLKGEGDDSND